MDSIKKSTIVGRLSAPLAQLIVLVLLAFNVKTDTETVTLAISGLESVIAAILQLWAIIAPIISKYREVKKG